MENNQFMTWHGMKRSDIDWHPTIDEKKCVGCGLCVVTCSEKRNVFGYDVKRKKAVVMFPDNCMVGCANCMVGCLWDAISFPDSQKIRDISSSLDRETISRELEEKIARNPAMEI